MEKPVLPDSPIALPLPGQGSTFPRKQHKHFLSATRNREAVITPLKLAMVIVVVIIIIIITIIVIITTKSFIEGCVLGIVQISL